MAIVMTNIFTDEWWAY